MSIELILIPMAVAAVSGWQAKRAIQDDGRPVIAVGTRMRDPQLLAAALEDLNATVSASSEVLTATWVEYQGRFTREPDGVWALHLAGNVSTEDAAGLVQRIDAAYGRHVQRAVLARLKERAPTAGMTVASETVDEDDTVTLVLNLAQGV